MKDVRAVLAMSAMMALGVSASGSLLHEDEDSAAYDPFRPRRKVAGRAPSAPPRDHYTSEQPLTKRQKRRLRGRGKSAKAIEAGTGQTAGLEP